MFDLLLHIYCLYREWQHPPAVTHAKTLGVILGTSFFFSPHNYQCPFDPLSLIFLEPPLCFSLTQALVLFRSSLPAIGITASPSPPVPPPLDLPHWCHLIVFLMQVWSCHCCGLKIFLKFMTFKSKLRFFVKAWEIHSNKGLCSPHCKHVCVCTHARAHTRTHTHTHAPTHRASKLKPNWIAFTIQEGQPLSRFYVFAQVWKPGLFLSFFLPPSLSIPTTTSRLWGILPLSFKLCYILYPGSHHIGV